VRVGAELRHERRERLGAARVRDRDLVAGLGETARQRRPDLAAAENGDVHHVLLSSGSLPGNVARVCRLPAAAGNASAPSVVLICTEAVLCRPLERGSL
jgi:hypothetical protein